MHMVLVQVEPTVGAGMGETATAIRLKDMLVGINPRMDAMVQDTSGMLLSLLIIPRSIAVWISTRPTGCTVQVRRLDRKRRCHFSCVSGLPFHRNTSAICRCRVMKTSIGMVQSGNESMLSFFLLSKSFE